MQRFILNIFVFSFLVVSPGEFAVAQDNAAVNFLSNRLVQENPLASPFHITLTSHGKLIVHPGEAFTEGRQARQNLAGALAQPREVGGQEGMELPYLISDPKPMPYPQWAIQEGVEGQVVLAIEIRSDGGVGETEVMQSSGNTLLDELAREFVKDWRFHPAMKSGQPITECIQIPIVFQIEN